MTLEETLLSVWRQALDEHLNLVEIEGERFPVRRTQRHRLRQVDFKFGTQTLRGLEQNPATRSRWAELARGGQKVMQFLNGGRYIGNVADGNVTLYRTAPSTETKSPARGASGSSQD